MTLIKSEEWLAKPGSVGRALLGEVRVCDDDGRVLPAGSTGTIYFAREERQFEYLGDPAKTRDAHHPDHPNWPPRATSATRTRRATCSSPTARHS